MSVGQGRRPVNRRAGAGTAKPAGEPPTPANQERNEPSEQNRIGEAQRREINDLKRRLDEKDKQDRGNSDAKSVLAAINKGLGKPGGLPAAKPKPRAPHPDLYYENPEKYDQDMETYTKDVAGREADGRVNRYDRTRSAKDQETTKNEHNDRVTEDFVASRPWLRGEDSEEVFQDFQQHIHDTGIEGRGPGGSLTDAQLVAAERSYRFEEMVGETASKTEAGIVNRMKAGQRSSSPRGSTPTPNTIEDAIGADPRLAVKMLRQFHDENGPEALTERFDQIPQNLRRTILPYFDGADK
jgi:hypothetical protein|tara:strand:- start:5838 stop:6728 length:891 start_codon:yes stop_codon:yes gene_type:complete